MKIITTLTVILLLTNALTGLSQNKVIKQKTEIDQGQKLTYSYYLDDNGKEVKNGTTTSIINKINKISGLWTGNETVTYVFTNGEMTGNVTIICNKTYWASTYQWVNGKRQEVFKPELKIIMPLTKFRVVNGILDGIININTGLYQIIGEAKNGYWVGRLIIKIVGDKGLETVFNEICDPTKEWAESKPPLHKFHTLDGFNRNDIIFPEVRYVTDEMLENYNSRKKKEEQEKNNRKAETERNFERLKKEIIALDTIIEAMFQEYVYRRAKEDGIIVSDLTLMVNKDSILLRHHLNEEDYNLNYFEDDTKLSAIDMMWTEESIRNENKERSFSLSVSPKFNEVFGNNIGAVPINRGSGTFTSRVYDPSFFLKTHAMYTNKLKQNKDLAQSEQSKLKETVALEKQKILAINLELQDLAQQLNSKFNKTNSLGYDFIAIEDHIEFITNVSYGAYVRNFGEWEDLYEKLYTFCYKQNKKTIEAVHVKDPKIISENSRIKNKDESIGMLMYKEN